MKTASRAAALAPGRITREQIAQFVTAHSQKKNAEITLSIFRNELLPLFRAAATQPADGPFILEYRTYERRSVDWQQVALDLATKLLGNEHKAIAHLAGILAKTEPTPVEEIRPAINPSYDTLARQGR